MYLRRKGENERRWDGRRREKRRNRMGEK